MPREKGKGQQRGANPVATEKYVQAASSKATFHPSVGGDPAVSTWVGEKAIIVMAEVPGAEPGKVAITVDGKRLILKNDGNGHHGQGVEFEKVINLPYRVDRNSIDVSCEKDFVNVILKREDEETLHKRTPLEAAIINTVSRYFNGNGARTKHAREKDDQFLIRALQRYFRGSAAATSKF